MMKDLIKCTIAELIGYLSETPVGAVYFTDNGKITIDYDIHTYQLFEYKNTGYKMLNFNGYISDSSCIFCVDDDNNILKKIDSGEYSTLNTILFQVPDGCTKILYFCTKDYVNKFSFLAFSTVEYDVTQCITDFDSLEVDMKRDGTSGTISEVSFPINLANAGKDFIKDIFEDKGLYAKAMFFIYKRGDYNNEYTLLKQIELDFSTYKEYEDKVTIEAAKTDLAEIINSLGKTKYDIPVNEIRESKQWKNEGIRISNNADYEIAYNQPISINENSKEISVSLPLSKNRSELAPGIEIDFKDESGSANSSDYFIQNNTNEEITVTANIRMYVNSEVTIVTLFAVHDSRNDYKNINTALVVRDFSPDGNYTDIIINTDGFPKLISQNSAGEYAWHSKVELNNRIDGRYDLKIASGHKLGMYLKFYHIKGYSFGVIGNIQYTDPYKNGSKFFVYFLSKNTKSINIDVINPLTLIQTFLDKMSKQKGLFLANIEWEDEPAIIRIVASESIRKLDNANLHGSPNDFFDWMRVLGYEYEIEGVTLNFRRRNKFFQQDNIATSMRDDEIADLIIQADSTYAYTSIEIGYEKQDYESVSGKCEANGTFSYTTQYITREDNKLSLVSPYRADSIGIEKLRNDVLGETSDKKSDNDIFFVAMVENSEYYSEFNDIVIRDESGDVDDMYNACYNPYYLVQRNMSLIGINANDIKFQSTDMSRGAYLYDKKKSNRINMYSNQTIDVKLFSPIEYNFAAGSWKDLPAHSVRNGLIQFEWKGEILSGFIKEIRKNYASESETTWILHAVK